MHVGALWDAGERLCEFEFHAAVEFQFGHVALSVTIVHLHARTRTPLHLCALLCYTVQFVACSCTCRSEFEFHGVSSL